MIARAAQPLMALEVANETRRRRAALKRDLRSRDRTASLRLVAELLVGSPAPELATLPLEQLVLWCPRVGMRGVDRICRRAFGARIPSRPLGRLTPRELEALQLALLVEAGAA